MTAGGIGEGTSRLMHALAPDCLPDGELLDTLTMTPLDECSPQELVLFAMAAQRVAGYAEALLAQAAVALTTHLPPELVQLELAAALNVAEATAGDVLTLGQRLAAFPVTAEAMEAGAVTARHAKVIVAALAPTDPRVAAELEPQLIALAATLSPGKLRRRARQLVAAGDPAEFTRRAAAAAEERRVVHYDHGDGQGSVLITGPAAQTRAVYLALDALAGPGNTGDPRSADQRRFDAAAELAMHTLRRDDLPRRHRRPVTLGITLTLPAALGLTDTPAHLDGYGPIPAEAARQLAGDAHWRAFVLDAATAHLLALGSHTHDLGAAAQAFIEARDGTCSFPSCSVPASRCHTEHATPWPDGPSHPANCGPVSHRHHNAKTHGGWQLTRQPDGHATWTSPLGFTYHFHPPPHPLDE